MTNEQRKIILGAIDRVKAGWCQGDYSRFVDGVNCFCASGAIMIESGGFLSSLDSEVRKLVLTAIRPLGFSTISDWNDDPSRTQAEVIALLESVANQSDPLAGWREIEA